MFYGGSGVDEERALGAPPGVTPPTARRRVAACSAAARVVDARGAPAGHARRPGPRRPDRGDRRPASTAPGAEVDRPRRAAGSCPGLMNAHAHLCLDGGAGPGGRRSAPRTGPRPCCAAPPGSRRPSAPASPRSATSAASTASTSSWPRLVETRRDPRARGSSPSGRVVTMTGGHGWWMGIQADGPDAVRRAARENLRAGARLDQADGDRRDDDRRPPGRPAAADRRGDGGRRRRGAQARRPGGGPRREPDRRPQRHRGRASIRSSTATAATSEAIELMLERGRRARADDPVRPPDHRARRRGRASRTSSSSSATPCTRASSSSSRRPSGRASRSPPGNDGGAPLVPIGDMVGELELYVRHGMTRPGGTRQRHDRHRRPVRTGRRRTGRDRATSRTCWSLDRRPAGVDRGAARHRGVIVRGGVVLEPDDRAAAGEPGAPASMTTGRAAMIVGARVGR